MLSCYNQIVEIFVLSCFLKRENASNDYEEDDAGGEDVRLPTVIQFALLDLGGHVGHGSTIGLEAFDLSVRCETVIRQFYVHFVVEKNVLDFDVAMYYVLLVHILHCADQLPEEEAAGVFAHAAQVLTQVEHEAAANVLHGDVDDVFDDFAGWLYDFAIGAIIHHFDDVFVVHAA